jgi:hypothetical protein
MNHNHRLLNRNIILVHISLSIYLSVFAYNRMFGNKKTDDSLFGDRVRPICSIII